MKITGGKYRNRNIYMPKDIRPTQNVTRKAIFDILGHDLSDLEVLELFAGSGAVGIEAISFGAERVFFVEKDRKAFSVLRENMDLLGMEMDAEGRYPYSVYQTDAFAAVKDFAAREKRFDIIIADPPYGRELGKKILKTLEAYDILQPTGLIIIQHPVKEILPEDSGRILLFKRKRYGKTFLSIYKNKD